MAATRLCNIMQQLSVSCSTGTERLVSRLEKKKKKKAAYDLCNVFGPLVT